VPILAAHVPRALTGRDDVEQALRTLRCEHPGLLVVTLGERGSVALDGDRFLHVPAPRVHAIDTTGAGDVFRAGVIYSLLQQWTTEETLRFANTAAALGCTRRGAITAVPTIEEIQAALA
jgi:sugar/nucleoside kinase (ribokinase family)